MKITKNDVYELISFVLGISVYTMVWCLYLKTKMPMNIKHISVIFFIFLLSGVFGRCGSAVYRNYFLKN